MSTEMPFCEGLRAGLYGVDPRACPHEKMTAEHNQWQRGVALAGSLIEKADAGDGDSACGAGA